MGSLAISIQQFVNGMQLSEVLGVTGGRVLDFFLTGRSNQYRKSVLERDGHFAPCFLAPGVGEYRFEFFKHRHGVSSLLFHYRTAQLKEFVRERARSAWIFLLACRDTVLVR